MSHSHYSTSETSKPFTQLCLTHLHPTVSAHLPTQPAQATPNAPSRVRMELPPPCSYPPAYSSMPPGGKGTLCLPVHRAATNITTGIDSVREGSFVGSSNPSMGEKTKVQSQEVSQLANGGVRVALRLAEKVQFPGSLELSTTVVSQASNSVMCLVSFIQGESGRTELRLEFLTAERGHGRPGGRVSLMPLLCTHKCVPRTGEVRTPRWKADQGGGGGTKSKTYCTFPSASGCKKQFIIQTSSAT